MNDSLDALRRLHTFRSASELSGENMPRQPWSADTIVQPVQPVSMSWALPARQPAASASDTSPTCKLTVPVPVTSDGGFMLRCSYSTDLLLAPLCLKLCQR